MGGRDTSAVPYDLDRRRFLQGAALAACAAGASLGHAAAEDPPTSAATLDRIKALLAGNDALTWVITGDSITHGALHTLGWRSYPEHFAERAGNPEAAVRLAFGRDATELERRSYSEYAGRHGLTNLCRLLFNTNEFLFVD